MEVTAHFLCSYHLLSHPLGCLPRRSNPLRQVMDASPPPIQDASQRSSSFWSLRYCESLKIQFCRLLLMKEKIYGVIFIGSTTAFSSMVNASIIFQQTSCIIPQAIVLYRGRGNILPERYFDLGRFGPLVNAIAIAWVVFLDVLYCVPTSMPVTPQNMSYVSVVVVGLISIILVLWFLNKRKDFTGPHVDYNLLNERRMANLHGASTIEAAASETGSIQSKGLKADVQA